VRFVARGKRGEGDAAGWYGLIWQTMIHAAERGGGRHEVATNLSRSEALVLKLTNKCLESFVWSVPTSRNSEIATLRYFPGSHLSQL